jgi:hypothetical protein
MNHGQRLLLLRGCTSQFRSTEGGEPDSASSQKLDQACKDSAQGLPILPKGKKMSPVQQLPGNGKEVRVPANAASFVQKAAVKGKYANNFRKNRGAQA